MFLYLFIVGCTGYSLLQGFSVVAESGDYSLVVVPGLLIEVASLIVEHRLQDMWAQLLWFPGSRELAQ